MFTLTVMPEGKTYECEEGPSLLDHLLNQEIFVDNPCNGKGICGKCRVRIVEGSVGELTETESKFIGEADALRGIRLSCLVYPSSDITVELLQKERKHDVLIGGYVPEFDFNVDIRKELVEIHRPTLEDQTPFEDQMRAQLGLEDLNFDCLRSARFQPGVATAVLHDNTIIQVENGDTTDVLYGAAVDIGTTTVVCSLIDMKTGRELSHASMVNAQKHFGLDVLTRITYELEHPEDGIQKLQSTIVASINDMLAEACKKAQVKRENIYEICVAANCTMQHTLLGVDATPIGKAPFAPMFVKSRDIPAASIGIKIAEGARLYCLPSVSAYIGADIVAGAYVTELAKEAGNVLFIDIGTNGEIVLGSHGKLMSCSCAAGPALEGMNISAGMRAEAGAIEEIEITPEGNKLQVIGDEAPIGICGSGILAVMKELLKTGFVRKEGAFVKLDKLPEGDWRLERLQQNGNKREFIMSESPEKLLVTQSDVRQIQLAKGAILSGFVALLDKAGIEMNDLDKVLIAGQFGAHLSPESITGTGILPFEVQDRIEYVGNTSRTGAYMALMSSTAKREMEELAHQMDYMELGATKNYEQLFSSCLIFPDYSKINQ